MNRNIQRSAGIPSYLGPTNYHAPRCLSAAEVAIEELAGRPSVQGDFNSLHADMCIRDAAPDLLAALKRITDDRSEESVAQAMAAIRRAENRR